jgi:DNA-binding transcriptional MocR family regulator
VRPEQVLVTVGAQHALFVALAARTRPGDVVLAEVLTYHGLRAMARLLNLELRGVRLDRDGLDPEDLERQARRAKARVVICLPSFQNPTGTVMPLRRRREVVEVARRRDLTLIEDDVYGFLLPAPPPPLAALAPERTFHLTGTSKSLSPALRVGYLVGPDAGREALAGLVAATVWGVSAPAAEIVASWIERGTADRIVAAKRALVSVRQRIARRALAGLRSASHPASPHLWVPVPARWKAEALVAAAAARGVRLLGAETFWLGREQPPSAVRVCLGAAPDVPTLESALLRLRALAAGAPADPAPIV